MVTLTERLHRGAFILSIDDDGNLSRDNATLVSGAGALNAGTVLGKITASGKYTLLAPGASDGSQTAAAILYDYTDATSADKKCVVVNTHAEVNGLTLTWPSGITAPQKATAIAQLAAIGVKVR